LTIGDIFDNSARQGAKTAAGNRTNNIGGVPMNPYKSPEYGKRKTSPNNRLPKAKANKKSDIPKHEAFPELA
jgi:hypothetical protein